MVKLWEWCQKKTITRSFLSLFRICLPSPDEPFLCSLMAFEDYIAASLIPFADTRSFATTTFPTAALQSWHFNWKTVTKITRRSSCYADKSMNHRLRICSCILELCMSTCLNPSSNSRLFLFLVFYRPSLLAGSSNFCVDLYYACQGQKKKWRWGLCIVLKNTWHIRMIIISGS